MRKTTATVGALCVLLALTASGAGSGATPECPPGGAETLAVARRAMTDASDGAAASRRRVGIDHLGPDDVRLLRDPADAAACRTVRRMPVVMGWSDTEFPNPNLATDDIERGYFAVGNVFLVAAYRDPVVTLPSGDFQIRRNPGYSVDVISRRGRDLGMISF